MSWFEQRAVSRPVALAKVLAVAALLLALGACGFRLQGTADLPAQMQQTWISWPASASAGLRRNLPRALTELGVTIAADPEDATAVLDIVADSYGERVLSVSANNIPEELEVYHSVTFELRAAEEIVFPRETITLTRDYTFDETAVLAKYREGELIADALVRDAIQQILRRLAVLE